MNIGKLVREKMKALAADCAGEYADNVGRHYTLTANGDGYTVSYGGGKKEIDISREQAHALVKHSRKLGGGEKKLAQQKPLNADFYIQQIEKFKNYAMSLTDPRMIEAQIARIQGISAGLIIGDYRNDPALPKVHAAQQKAVQEIENGKNYSKY